MHIPLMGARASLRTVGAFQSICKLSTLMARQSHPVVTKHRGRHCLVCEEIVVPDRLNLFRLGSVRFRRGATENKDHSALIAPSRSNRGSRRTATTPSLSSSRVSRPVHFSPSFPFTFPSPGRTVWFRRSTAISHAKIKYPSSTSRFAQITLSSTIRE